jgi:hypothetical protein
MMKGSASPKPDAARQTPIRQLIQEATDARTIDLALIEHVMRDNVFHSTLDWQTAAQLRTAARQARSLLEENRDLYEMEQEQVMAFFEGHPQVNGVANPSTRSQHK